MNPLVAQRTLMDAPLPTSCALAEVAEERARQVALLEAGKIEFDCADPAVRASTKLPVLMEEVGEVAEAMQRAGRFSAGGREHLRQELIQVAAVAVAWAESLSASENNQPE